MTLNDLDLDSQQNLCEKKNLMKNIFGGTLKIFWYAWPKTFCVEIDYLREKNFYFENFWDLEYF
jgi:hypothetical protein